MKSVSYKKFLLVSFAAIAVLFFWSGLFANPAASQAQSRINALEVDLRGVKTRLNRIEAQLNQSRDVQVPTPPTITSSPRTTPVQNREQMFDQLATLVVELKQQVNQLETRVTNLEKSSSRRS